MKDITIEEILFRTLHTRLYVKPRGVNIQASFDDLGRFRRAYKIRYRLDCDAQNVGDFLKLILDDLRTQGCEINSVELSATSGIEGKAELFGSVSVLVRLSAELTQELTEAVLFSFQETQEQEAQ